MSIKSGVSFFLAAFAIMGVYKVYFDNPKEGLALGNITHNSSGVRFTLSNSGGKSGTVGIWFEQQGIKSCERFARISANRNYRLSIKCREMPVGDYDFYYRWADRDKRAARAVQVGEEIATSN